MGTPTRCPICQNVEAIEMFKTLGTTLSTNRNTACYDCIAMLRSERSMVIVNFLLFALFFPSTCLQMDGVIAMIKC